MEVTPQNIRKLFNRRWIPDGTVLYVQKNRTGKVIKGKVIDCRVYSDTFMVVLEYEGDPTPRQVRDSLALWGGFEFYKDYLTMKEQIHYGRLLIGDKKIYESFDYPHDKFTVLLPLRKLAASVVNDTNPDALYHSDNPSIARIGIEAEWSVRWI